MHDIQLNSKTLISKWRFFSSVSLYTDFYVKNSMSRIWIIKHHMIYGGFFALIENQCRIWFFDFVLAFFVFFLLFVFLFVVFFYLFIFCTFKLCWTIYVTYNFLVFLHALFLLCRLEKLFCTAYAILEKEIDLSKSKIKIFS